MLLSKSSKTFIFLILVIISSISQFFYYVEHINSGYFWAWMIFFTILLYTTTRRSKDIFDPTFLFSLFYITFSLSVFNLISTNFQNSQFINTTYFYSDNLEALCGTASYLGFIGYISFIYGYEIQKNENCSEFSELILETHKQISPLILIFIIYIFLAISLLNFTQNVFLFAHGNPLIYMKNIALRYHEFAKQGTTLGYNFAYAATFLAQFLYLRNSKKRYLLLFLAILIFATLLKASTGRVTDTIIFPMTFLITYYYKIRGEREVNNKKYLGLIFLFAILAITFYFLRVASSIIACGNDFNISTVKIFIKHFAVYTFAKGNTPNIAILMKIIDSWGIDIGYSLGKTMFQWILSPFPSSIRLLVTPVSTVIKQKWYLHIQGGALPPTAVGEMYANFGMIGPLVGMLFWGFVMGKIHAYIKRRRRLIGYIIYANILLGFIVIFPKVETHNLSLFPFIVYFLPYIFIRFLTLASITSKSKKSFSESKYFQNQR
ncbi:O-antigen polymerase [Aminobacterium mobile]|jgi:oligosaccharide repeat unit polymerase